MSLEWMGWSLKIGLTVLFLKQGMMIREICLAVLLIAAITTHVGGQWRGVRVQSLDGRARGFGAAGVFSSRRSRGGFGEGWGGPGGGGGGGGGGGKLVRHYNMLTHI